MALNLNRLRIFEAVLRAGSLTEAARRLRVTQPAVSRQLQELEAELGLALFDRRARGIRLTSAGAQLEPLVRRVLQHEAALEREAQALLGLHHGHLVVGASTTIGNYLVPELFEDIRARYPEVTLELEIGNTSEIQRKLVGGAVEIGLTEGLASAPELETQVFARDRLILIAAPSTGIAAESPLYPERVAALPFLLREAGSGSREVVEAAFAERGLALHPSLVLGSTEAIKQAATRGSGVGIVSSLTVELELELGRLCEVKIEGLELERDLHVVWPRDRVSSPTAAEFMRVLGERYHLQTSRRS